MGVLLDRVANQQHLLQSWQDLRAAVIRENGESPELAAFGRQVAKTLATVSRQLAAGQWVPAPVHSVRIPKAAGGARVLGVPPLADRVVERAILNVLDPIVDPEMLPWSFAYRRGVGVADAVRALTEARDDGAWGAVRLDFARCFDSIPRRGVMERLAAVVPDEALVAVVKSLVYRPVAGRASVPSRGLHQGSPLSPLLANLLLDRFDRALLRQGYTVLRYADDLAIPVNGPGEAQLVVGLAQREAAAMGMAFGGRKADATSFVEGVPFLGALVTQGMRARQDRLDHPDRVTLYVTSPNSLLRSRGDRIRVEVPEEEKPFSIAIDRVRQVVVFGRVGITTPLLHRLLKRDVDVTLLSDHGHFFGRLQGSMAGNAQLRAFQYSLAGSPRALEIAQRIVAGKIANQRTLLLRAARRRDIVLHEQVERLGALRKRAAEMPNINALMGVEGAASREYHLGFGQLLGNGFVFVGRRRRPPPDPVNSLLSFGYTLLVQETISAVEAAGLDPYEGVLHQRRLGRPSLALDLVEEFRPVIVDAVVLRLINTGMVTLADFSVPESDDAPCLLLAEARKTVLAAYERRMLTVTTHAPSGRRVSYRVALGLQARELAAELNGSSRVYAPMTWK